MGVGIDKTLVSTEEETSPLVRKDRPMTMDDVTGASATKVKDINTDDQNKSTAFPPYHLSTQWVDTCETLVYDLCELPDRPCEYSYLKSRCTYNPKLVDILKSVNEYRGECLSLEKPFTSNFRGLSYCTNSKLSYLNRLALWFTGNMTRIKLAGYVGGIAQNIFVPIAFYSAIAVMHGEVSKHGFMVTSKKYAKAFLQGVAIGAPLFLMTRIVRLACMTYFRVSSLRVFTDLLVEEPIETSNIMSSWSRTTPASLTSHEATSFVKENIVPWLSTGVQQIYTAFGSLYEGKIFASGIWVGVVGAFEEISFRKDFDKLLEAFKRPCFFIADHLARLFRKDKIAFRRNSMSILTLLVSSITFALMHLVNFYANPFKTVELAQTILCQVVFTSVMGLILDRVAKRVDGILPLWFAHFAHNYFANTPI